MGRTKRSSKILDKATQRAGGLRSVSATLDFGNGLSLSAFDAAIADTRTKLDAYNQMLSTVDEMYNQLLASEESLRDMSERMLSGVLAKFGKDSNEYEQAGGVRKSERRARTSSKSQPSPTS